MPDKDVTKEAKVKVSGGARFAAIDVEAQSVPLFRNGTIFEGKRRVTLSPESVEIFLWVKGGTGATFKAEVTINSKTASIEGAVGAAGQVKRTKHVPFSDFSL
jgi:hypothetical protein